MAEGNLFSRKMLIERLKTGEQYDVVVIGGGATGLGVALDAASRGLSTVLFEQYDFAKGTSSRSTKLIHGGVRYLAQGDLKLVYSALQERDVLSRNASHVVKSQSFVIPCYSVWDIIKYTAGLKLYDLLAGSLSFGKSRFLDKRAVEKRMHNIAGNGLRGGIEYFDGQFDDARLAVNIAQTAIEQSAIVLNYFRVTAIRKEGNQVSGVAAIDEETGKEYTVKAKTVINATGVFVDNILKMDEPTIHETVRPSQGMHLVIDRKFMNGNSALMIPKTSDGRVLFAVPWQGQLLVGTTDTPIEQSSAEPRPLEIEINFILQNLNKYLLNPPSKTDVKSIFAGLRPLAATGSKSQATKELSRDHKLFTSASGLITITGGKWTTYRKMAEETVDLAVKAGALKPVKSATKRLVLHGCKYPSPGYLSQYGTDEENIRQLITRDSSLAMQLVEEYPYTLAEAVWAIRHEMARTVEDVLARRLRLLFIDADAAIKAAPLIADLFRKELGYDDNIIDRQLNDFYTIASQYKIQPI